MDSDLGLIRTTRSIAKSVIVILALTTGSKIAQRVNVANCMISGEVRCVLSVSFVQVNERYETS